MPPKRDASKSPAKGARKRSPSKARSKSPGRPKSPSRAGRPPKTDTPAAKSAETPKSAPSSAAPRPRGRSKSPSRKGNAETPAQSLKKAARAQSAGRKKTSPSPPAKKASSPKRTKRASTPSAGKKSIAPAVAELTSDISSAIAKKIGDMRESLTLRKREEPAKDKVTSVTRTEVTTTTRREKRDEHVVDKAHGKREFGGPIGALLYILFLPAIVIAVNLACTKKSCTLTTVPEVPTACSAYYNVEALKYFFGFLIAQAILAALPIGRVKEGLPLPNGKRLKYRCNAFFSLLLSAVAFSVLHYLQFPLTAVVDLFLPLSVTAVIFAFAASILLYVRSRFRRTDELSPGGNTGNVIYDFFVGRWFNPRVGLFDLKTFYKLHFGAIAWAWLNATFVLKAYEETGTLPHALILVTSCQLLYITETLWNEESALSTMAIASDGLGFHMMVRVVALVPFVYTLHGRYLLQHPQNWHYGVLAALFVLNAVGFYIFRTANWQKHAILTTPHHRSVAALESIPAAGGQRVLVGGWWGLCRHPNYLGDLIMALAWTLPCGFDSPLPYLYPVSLLFLLVHRASRDGRQCHQRFGSAWERYCQRVKYRIIPYIY